MTSNPSPTAENGRGQAGRFTIGNSFGRGNPHASKVQKLRAAMLNTVTEEDISTIVRGLVMLARNRDLKAAKMILDLIGCKSEGDTSPGLEITEANFERIKNELLARAN